ncbi:hypothetical protein [Gilvimarinus agarilyticus]|uniref:hypothetical protein n=1 Tax=Gilvimarinus agarilyticus TaxID=679259 RepID=UPI0005A1F2E4|nr:hypothetical protein [Gilvimarinus agarilyticus]
MNWLERYTFAVKSHLPASVRNDVADELLSDLQDERDYREESLGRPLTDDELKALLRERGHPMLVAADFQPRPTLVSESLFPIYRQLLQWMVIAIAAVQLCLMVAAFAGAGEVRLWQALPQLLWSILEKSLYGFAWLTLIFYLLGESVSRADIFTRWRPESLPKVIAEGDYISRTATTFELVVTVYFAAWLNRVIPQSLGDNPIGFVFSDQWATLLPWINAVLLGSIVLAVSKLLFPYWTRRKIIEELALYIPSLIIMAVIYGWDAPLTIVIGTGETSSQWAISSLSIALAMAAYALFALYDSVKKIQLYRAI